MNSTRQPKFHLHTILSSAGVVHNTKIFPFLDIHVHLRRRFQVGQEQFALVRNLNAETYCNRALLLSLGHSRGCVNIVLEYIGGVMAKVGEIDRYSPNQIVVVRLLWKLL